MNYSSDEDDLWEAMADPTRRKLLDLLVARGQAQADHIDQQLIAFGAQCRGKLAGIKHCDPLSQKLSERDLG